MMKKFILILLTLCLILSGCKSSQKDFTETGANIPAAETVEEDPSTLGTEKKKLYRYDYGDILNGISFSVCA